MIIMRWARPRLSDNGPTRPTGTVVTVDDQIRPRTIATHSVIGDPLARKAPVGVPPPALSPVSGPPPRIRTHHRIDTRGAERGHRTRPGYHPGPLPGRSCPPHARRATHTWDPLPRGCHGAPPGRTAVHGSRRYRRRWRDPAHPRPPAPHSPGKDPAGPATAGRAASTLLPAKGDPRAARTGSNPCWWINHPDNTGSW